MGRKKKMVVGHIMWHAGPMFDIFDLMLYL